MNLTCIYHDRCADGFTSAWIVNKAILEGRLGNNLSKVNFYKAIYGEPAPDCTGQDIVMVDFSYKRDVLLQMAEEANSILILDHHKSAQSDLVDLPDNVIAVFDMDRSGAMITWNHYFPEKMPSDLIIHVQDRDLWLFKREQTRAFQANLFSYEYTFENWDKIEKMCADDYKYHQFVAEGEVIERKHFKDVKELINVAGTRNIIGGFDVPVLNAPYFYSSDAGHIMAENEPFAACYWLTGKGVTFSLRSTTDGEDVSKIASEYGGGGHKNAAGFNLTFAQLMQSDNIDIQGVL